MKEVSKAKQIDAAVKIFKSLYKKLPTTEEWLVSLAYCKTNDEFKRIGDPICDGIIFPKCPLLFDKKKEPYKQMEIFFTRMGLPVKHVGHSVKADYVFIQLDDARNMFTSALMKSLRNTVSVLTLRTYLALIKKGFNEENDEEYILSELRKVIVRQFDFTQDISGFIMFSTSLANPCTDLFNAIKELGDLIGMEYSKEYKQLLTCVQYIAFNKDG